MPVRHRATRPSVWPITCKIKGSYCSSSSDQCFDRLIYRILYAIEKNTRRFKELNGNLKSAGVKCARTMNEDFLEVDLPSETIEYILLDPTCSGSGIRHRNEEHEPIDEERLARLAALQIRMISFALTHFPRVKRLTYSTCSIHRQENEQVVEAILDQHGETFQVRWRRSEGPHWMLFVLLAGRFLASMAESRTNRKNSRLSSSFSERDIDQWIFCCLFWTNNQIGRSIRCRFDLACPAFIRSIEKKEAEMVVVVHPRKIKVMRGDSFLLSLICCEIKNTPRTRTTVDGKRKEKIKCSKDSDKKRKQNITLSAQTKKKNNKNEKKSSRVF
jgi:hypothetical protein